MHPAAQPGRARQPSDMEALIGCSLPKASADSRERVRRLAGQVRDWNRLLARAKGHGAALLLADNLIAAADDLIPAETSGELRKLAKVCRWRNSNLCEDLLSLISQFETAEVPMVPMKGLVLTERLYRDIGLRASNDMDLLVHPRDFPRAVRVLLESGFEPLEEYKGPDLSTSRGEDFEPGWQEVMKRSVSPNFVRKSGNVMIELHWRIASPTVFPMPVDVLWQGVERVPFQGRTALAFAPADWVISLCVHGTKHWWNRLIWIYDIAAFVRAFPELDWSKAFARAKSLGCSRVLALGLLLAEELGGAKLPPSLSERIHADSAAQSLSQFVQNGILGEEEYCLSAPEEFRYLLRTKDRVQDQLDYLWRSTRHGIKSLVVRG